MASFLLLATALPFCGAMQVPAGTALESETAGGPPFLYVLGVEGSNHHGVVSQLLQPLVEERCNDAACNSTSESISDSTCPSRVRDGDLRSSLFVLNGDGLSHTFEQGNKEGAFFVEDRSFPSGYSNRDLPYPVDLEKMFRIVSPIAKLKFLVLQRPFPQMVMSRQDFDTSVEVHAWKMVSYLTYLSLNLEKIPLNYWKVLPVECLQRGADERLLAKRRVASFLGISDACCGCFPDWVSPSKHSSDEDVDYIWEKTTSLWPVFNDRDGHSPYLAQYLLNPVSCQ